MFHTLEKFIDDEKKMLHAGTHPGLIGHRDLVIHELKRKRMRMRADRWLQYESMEADQIYIAQIRQARHAYEVSFIYCILIMIL